jgi:hypothetical protein
MPVITLNNQYVSQGPNIVMVPFFLTADRTFISAPSEGGTYSTSVYTHPANPWAVTDSCTWISIVGGSGTGNGSFSIVVDERFVNETYELSGRVTISSKAATWNIDITQAPIADRIVLTPDSCTFLDSGYPVGPVFQVDSYIAGQPTNSWTAAAKTNPGTFITSVTGGGNFGEDVWLQIDQNANQDARQGTIEVSIGTAVEYFSICQDGITQLCSDI